VPKSESKVLNEIQKWRSKVNDRTSIERRRFNSNEVFLSETMRRQKWRTSRDTEEIEATLKPSEYPVGGMPFITAKERFSTTNARVHKQMPAV